MKKYYVPIILLFLLSLLFASCAVAPAGEYGSSVDEQVEQALSDTETDNTLEIVGETRNYYVYLYDDEYMRCIIVNGVSSCVAKP